MTVPDWLTLLGPLLGAGFVLWIEPKRQKRGRRLDIFKTLMRTRRTPVWPEHVGALNLVELEFHDNREVIVAWKLLFEHFGKPQPRRGDEDRRFPDAQIVLGIHADILEADRARQRGRSNSGSRFPRTGVLAGRRPMSTRARRYSDRERQCCGDSLLIGF